MEERRKTDFVTKDQVKNIKELDKLISKERRGEQKARLMAYREEVLVKRRIFAAIFIVSIILLIVLSIFYT